jgi:hypothetical protein
MKATVLYRIAAVLLIIFAAGHTIGFLQFRPETSEGRAVFESMNSVHFEIGRNSFTYGGFYNGFGLFATLYLLFSAYLAWHLGALAGKNPSAIGALGWVFCAVQVVSLVLSWKYFLPPPIILSALVAICLGWATWLVNSAGQILPPKS